MLKKLLLLLTIISFTLAIKAQIYPVVSTTQIIPPYSVYLTDYASASSDKLIANLLLQDQNQSGIQVKLKITITGDNGVKLETKPEFLPPPITLYPNIPEQIKGIDLQNYLEPMNLNITGLNISQFMQSKKLPEGIYQFTVEAVEYRRNKTISNPGTAVGWLILNDPPIWNLPQHNTTITATNPQNIFFSWFPMHSGSPNAAFTTEYEFSLYDLIPQTASPDEYVNIAVPIHQSTTMNNSFVYGTAEIPLEPGRKYAARLKAYDTEGRDMFKNNGYSTVLVFTYGQQCITPVGITHQDLTPHTANISWTAIPGNTEFEIYYREKTDDPNTQWYVGTTSQTSATVNQLKPQHTYQYVLRALCGTLESEPSAIYEFTTPEKIITQIDCGDNPNVPEIDGSPPLEDLFVGDVINVGGFEGIITQARGGNGVFSGKCIMRVSNFNILLKSHFTDIHINQSYQVTEGNVIADRGPGIMINLDEIAGDLDSLANVPIDTILNYPDDYIEGLEDIYDLEPEIITDSISEDLITIEEKLNILLEEGDLTEEQIQEIEDLLGQIANLQEKYFGSDPTLKILIKIPQEPPLEDFKKYLKDDEKYYVSQNANDTLRLYATTNTQDTLSNPKWYINETQIDSSQLRVPGDSSYCMMRFTPDSLGTYEFKFTTVDDSVKINVFVVNKPVVTFNKKDSYNGEYGFERYEYIQLKDTFINDSVHRPIQVHGQEYIPAWLSLEKGKSALLKTEILIPDVYPGMKINFRSSKPDTVELFGKTEYLEPDLQKGWNVFELGIRANKRTGLSNDSIESVIVTDETNTVIGNLNVQSEVREKFQEHRFVLIKLITDSARASKIHPEEIVTDLEDFLNYNSYNQVFIRWEHVETKIFDIRDILPFPLCDAVNYNPENAVNFQDTLKLDKTLELFFNVIIPNYADTTDRSLHYIFISDKKIAFRGLSSSNGDDKYKIRYVIMNPIDRNAYDIYTHELGHNCTLKHTFMYDGGNVPEASTTNFMDYSRILKYFWKWQGERMKRNHFED